MLKLILYKELKEITGSAKFAATFGVCSILIIMAFYTGIKNYHTGIQEYNDSKAAQIQQFATVTDWGYVSSNKIFLPPEPLACLVMGISNDIGRTATVDGGSHPFFDESTYSEQSVFAVFRFLDLEFVFQIIFSLFAILFAFDAVNGEKERGTLRLSFANSVPRANYITGKLTGSFFALVVPLIIPVLIGILMLPIMGVPMKTDEWIQLVLFLMCSFLYLGVFLTMSVFMSCLTKRSSSSFLFLLVIWVFSVLIIPRASVLIAGNSVEVPSLNSILFQQNQMEEKYSIERSKRYDEFSDSLRQELYKSRDDSQEALDRYLEKTRNFSEQLSVEYNKKIDSLIGRLYEERHNKQIEQQKLAFSISRLSPTSLFTLVSSALCGTSINLKNQFYKNAASYSKSLSEFIKNKTGHAIGTTPASFFNQDDQAQKKPPKPIDTGEIPEFIFQAPELSAVIYEAIPDIAILLLFNMIFFCGSFLAFLRYDLR